MSLTKIKSSNITTTGVTAGSYTAADITVNSSGQVTSASSGTGGGGATVTILSVIVTSDTYANLDDTAVDISGGYIKIIGTGFASGCTVLVNNIPATSTTFIGPTEVRAQLPATAAGTYVLYVVNANGSVAIRVNGITFSATPSWINSSDLSSYPLNESISIQLSATSATTYALQSGSSLPAGLTLSSSGLLSGTVTGLENDTSYSFAVIATDAELQDSPRTFTITIVVQVQVSRSLRFNATDTTYLSRTFPTAGNRRLWTFSAWYKRSNLTDTGNGLFQYGPDGNNQFRLLLDSSGTIIIMDRISAVYIVSMTTTAVFRDPGAWYHIVITYDTAQATAADRVKLYINGTQITSFSTPTYPSQNAEGNVCSASTAYIGRGDTTSVYYYSGYLTEVQLVDGQALTPTAFALTNTTTGQYGPRKYMGSYGTNGFYLPFTDNSSVLNLGRNYEPLTADPLWPQTVLLLNGTGTNNANNNTFIDSSANNFTITRNGNTTQGTFSPFSQTGWGGYFDGSGDYLTAPNNAAFGFGASDFTIEAWIFPTAFSGFNSVFCVNVSGGLFFGAINGTTSFGLRAAAVSDILTATSPSLNTWTHVAVTRSGVNVYLFYNGVQQATTTSSYSFAQSSIGIGSDGGNSSLFTGYISNLRVIKGQALYTSAFTPSTTSLTTTSQGATAGNVSLLTCQSNRFIDNSSNNFTITRNGDTRVVAFSPFTPTTAYSAVTNGGSGYFDGSGDYLRTTGSALAVGSGTFTYEAWVYPTSLAASISGIFDSRIYTGSAGTNGIGLFLTSVGEVRIDNSAGAILTTSGAAITVNSWVHIAAEKSGGNLIIYVNGVSKGSVANSATYSSTEISIGTSFSNAWPFTGYISSFRLVTSAVYGGNFTPPTAPLTAIANTQLLLNFTNAGILDATSKNDLETVGNAQISTAISAKWGSGSMYFDGSGDGVSTPNNNLIKFGTGNFTIEMWLYTSNPTTYQTIMDARSADTASSFLINTVSGRPYWYDASGAITSASLAIASNTWTHLAIARSGSTLKIFLNGTEAASGTNSNSIDPTGVIYIGRDVTNAVFWNGYMQDVRITKGYARYTGNFTPPTAQFAYNQGDINYNQWVPTNFSVTAGAGNDSVVDTPTNWGVDTGLGGEVRGNYCTWNLLEPSIGTRTITNGALDVTNSGNGSTYSNFGMSTGKWYFECTLTAQSGAAGSCYVGLTASTLSKSINNAQNLNPGVGYCMDGTKGIDGTPTSYGATYAVNDIIGCAVDIDAGSVTFYKNGVSQGTITKTLLGQGTGSWIIYTVAAAGAASNSWTLNAGQRPFAYSAPSGFKSLNTHNLPALAVVKSNTAFDAVLYTGDGTNSRTITSSLGFTPDLVWGKSRSIDNWHVLVDSVRGNYKTLSSNATNAESSINSYNLSTANSLITWNSNETNQNGTTYAAWLWKANGAGSTNTVGSITSTVSVNTTSGFSIVSWTGTGANATVGHGLNAVPRFIIVRNRDTVYNWRVWHTALSGTQLLYLNTTDATVTDATMWNSTIPTSTVFSLGTNGGVNESTKNIIAYCFAAVPGFSAFGSYTGNGSADGPFVYTGFRPKFILLKSSTVAGTNWQINDTARDTYNVANKRLAASAADAEATNFDFGDIFSNGFKIRQTDQTWNSNGQTYIYAAFAEQPFKYSRAR